MSSASPPPRPDVASLIAKWRTFADELHLAPDRGTHTLRDIYRLRACANELEAALSSAPPAETLSDGDLRLAATSLEAEAIRFPDSLHAGRCRAVAAKLRARSSSQETP